VRAIEAIAAIRMHKSAPPITPPHGNPSFLSRNSIKNASMTITPTVETEAPSTKKKISIFITPPVPL
jgi:hypothetical protein